MAYSAKYASAFYGPFRDAAGSAPSEGDGGATRWIRPTAARRIREVLLDLDEGADMVMVKPAMPYLDVLARCGGPPALPIAAYQVSGEYAMIKAAAAAGWLDERAAALEALVAHSSRRRRHGDHLLGRRRGANGSGRPGDAPSARRGCSPRRERLIPGGVSSPVRAMRSVGRDYPLFVARGEGGWLFDVDGNRYVDWVLSWGPLIAGHAHPDVVEAVTAAAAPGTTLRRADRGRAGAGSARWCAAVPTLEMVRFVSSGTEATMSAVRLARAFTGRDKI